MKPNTIYHQLNETGNVFIRSNLSLSQSLPQAIQKEFHKTTLFIATMMKSISITINPKTGQPFSIYNYHALEAILTRSKLFSKSSENCVKLVTGAYSHHFSRLLFYQAFNIRLAHKQKHLFSSILSSMKNEAQRMLVAQHPEEYKVGYLIFVIEYINHKLTISVHTFYLDCHINKQAIEQAPWKHKNAIATSWHFQTAHYSKH